jgi:hypothetical protein
VEILIVERKMVSSRASGSEKHEADIIFTGCVGSNISATFEESEALRQRDFIRLAVRSTGPLINAMRDDEVRGRGLSRSFVRRG